MRYCSYRIFETRAVSICVAVVPNYNVTQVLLAVLVPMASFCRFIQHTWGKRALMYIVWQAFFWCTYTRFLKPYSVIQHPPGFTEVMNPQKTVVQFHSNRNGFYIRKRDFVMRCFITPKATRHVLLFLLFSLKIRDAWRTALCSSFVLYYSTALVVLLFHLSWISK